MSLIKRYRYEIIFFVLFCLSRAPYLGQEMFNTDNEKWKARIFDFGSGVFNLDLDKTLQKYHPGVTLMWIGTVAVKFQSLYCPVVGCPDESVDRVGAVLSLHFFQKFFIVLTIGAILTAAFYPLRRLFGKKYAFIAMAILSFEPFFYALTRVLHLEGLMTSFMLAAFVWLFYALQTSGEESRPVRSRHLILSAVFSGLAVLTKSSAMFILPLSFLMLFFYHKRNIRSLVKLAGIWTLALTATYFILWPSMWVHPIKTLDYVFIKGIKETGVEGEHVQIFLGQYTENPGFFYYFVVMAYKFSPVLITGILFFVLFSKKMRDHFESQRFKKFVIFSLIFTLGYLLEIIIPTKKLDRYILPSLMSLSLIVAFFYSWLIFTVVPKTYRYVAAGIFIIFTAFQSLYLTPDYFSYYNPMFGGLSKGIYDLEPKWIIGQHEISKYFSQLMFKNGLEPFTKGQSFDNQKDLTKKLTVAFPEKYYTQIWPFIRRTGGWATIEDLTPNASRTRYFVYPVWDDYSFRETRFKLTYVDSIYLRGVKLYNVYQRDDRKD